MKILGLIISSVIITTVLLISCNGYSIKDGTNISNEGKEENSLDSSESITIGSQVWMSVNLNVDTFRNGDSIPLAKTKEQWAYCRHPACCYYNDDPANESKYGKLYNWYAVNDPRGLAPKGWHIPSDEEWTQLTDLLGGEKNAGTKMKSTRGWFGNGIANGTNESSFSGLPGRMRFESGNFIDQGDEGYWWSSSLLYGTGTPSYRQLGNNNDFLVSAITRDWGEGMSVRCLKD
jgi:uncharacterized protein (TIGR02145 family)